MMQRLLKENILSLIECRTWASLPGNGGASAEQTGPGGAGLHRADPRAGWGGAESCFTSHPRDSWIREGRLGAVAEPGQAGYFP